MTSVKGLYNEGENSDLVNQSQFAMSHMPVRVVLVIDEHLPETNHV